LLVPNIPAALADRHDDAVLVLSEIVTNAVSYGSSTSTDEIRVSIEAEDGRLRVEVEQSLPAPALSSGMPPRRDTESGGYGLLIVERLSDGWGAEPGPPGRVWFEIRSEDDVGPVCHDRSP
jgi:anti-sigma regulatory factor (Ser/Thr protein kinase)